VVERELALSGEVLAEKYKDRLESSYRVIYLLIFKKSFIHLKMDPSMFILFLLLIHLVVYDLCMFAYFS
jgi:hypothetical protein